MTEPFESTQSVEHWVREHVDIATTRHGDTLHAYATCTLPGVSKRAFYELVTHPENYNILRSIQRCTHRKLLWNGGREHQVWDVENESDWKLLFFGGAIKTRMFCEQDANRGMLHFTLASSASSPLRDFYGCWSITDINPASNSDDDDDASNPPPSCHVTLYQRFTPRSLPPFFFPAFARLTVRHMQATFEDLLFEVVRQRHHVAILAPYHTVAMTQILEPHHTSNDSNTSSTEVDVDEETNINASNALAILLRAANASSWHEVMCGGDTQHRSSSASMTRSSASSMALSSQSEPRSHHLVAWGGDDNDHYNEEGVAGGVPPKHGGGYYSSYYTRLASMSKNAKAGWKAALRWIDDHMPLDEDSFEMAWVSAFGDDFFSRGPWLVVA